MKLLSHTTMLLAVASFLLSLGAYTSGQYHVYVYSAQLIDIAGCMGSIGLCIAVWKYKKHSDFRTSLYSMAGIGVFITGLELYVDITYSIPALQKWYGPRNLMCPFPLATLWAIGVGAMIGLFHEQKTATR